MADVNSTQAGARADRLDAAALIRLMPIVATRLLGEPNKTLSSAGELRFGANGSLSIDLARARWFDHSEGAGGGLLDLIGRELKATNGAAVRWLESEGLIEPQRPADRAQPSPEGERATRRGVIARYQYFDGNGAVIARKLRFSTAPRFGWQRPDGKGEWVDKLADVVPGLYRLPELLAAHSDSLIVICEGEKDADRAAAFGLIAVCGPHGGGKNKWLASYAVALAGRHVAVVPHNDTPGQEYAAAAIASLRDVASSVTLVALPDLEAKGDLSDWIAANGTLPEFMALYAVAGPIDFATVGDAGKANADPIAGEAGKRATITADVLGAMTFPALLYAVPNIIPEGLTLLAGKPKFGKSFLALGIAIAKATGGFAFGTIRCEAGDVLYAALEDSPRRLHNRLHQLIPFGLMPTRLHFRTDMPRLGAGLIEWLEQWLDQHPEAALIIFDTWHYIKPAYQRGGSAYDEDASALAPLHALAKKRPGLAVIVIHHTRKMEADDPFDMISGTFGLTGVADSLLVLAKHGEGAKLSGQGRDFDGFDKALVRDPQSGGWRIVGDTREIASTFERQALLNVLAEADGEALSTGVIAKAAGVSTSSASHRLKGLEAEGLIFKGKAYGKWVLNPHQSRQINQSYQDRQSCQSREKDRHIDDFDDIDGGIGDGR